VFVTVRWIALVSWSRLSEQKFRVDKWLPLFGNGGMIAVWAAGQIHPDISQVTRQPRLRGMCCRTTCQQRLNTWRIKNSTCCSNAVVAERLRRGMKSPVPEKTPSQRTVDAAAVYLNLGKLNAVRAAFKAGVTPSKIAKEFGISQADVRKVIVSEGLKR